MVEKEKRKNVDLEAIRSHIEELRCIEVSENERRAEVIVQKIMSNISAGKAHVSSYGYITVRFFSVYNPNACGSFIHKKLAERGLTTAHSWITDSSFIDFPFMHRVTLQLKDK